MYRYENAITVLKAAGLYSVTVANALRAEFRRQNIRRLQDNMQTTENLEVYDTTEEYQRIA